MSSSSYCPNCGASSSPDSIFCEQCGYQMLAGSRGKQTTPKMGAPEEISKPAFLRESQSTRRHFRRYRDRHSHKNAKITFLAIFLTVIIIGGAMFAFFILPQLDTSYVHIGNEYLSYYDYDNPAMTEAEFIIDNAVGGIHIHFNDNSSDELVAINMDITGRIGVSKEDTSQFETYSYGNRTLFIFNSVDRTLPNSKWYDYQYNIDIRINTQIMGAFNIHVSSGIITFHSGVNARVSELLLDVTSGYIDTDISYTTFLNTQGSNIIKTVSGEINSYFVNLMSENTTSWDISSISGGIHLDMVFESEPTESRQMNFEVDTISGDITYVFSPYFHYNSSEELSLSYAIDANTLTGSIALIGYYNETDTIEFPYTTPNYGSALLNFDLTFTTVSGSIFILKK